MRIGRMDKRVAVQNPGRTPDGDGGYVDAFVADTLSPVWASIEPAETPVSAEKLAGATIEAKYTHVIEMRYHANVTTKTQLVLGARVFCVRAVVNTHERNERLVLACEEKKAA